MGMRKSMHCNVKTSKELYFITYNCFVTEGLTRLESGQEKERVKGLCHDDSTSSSNELIQESRGGEYDIIIES